MKQMFALQFCIASKVGLKQVHGNVGHPNKKLRKFHELWMGRKQENKKEESEQQSTGPVAWEDVVA